jgi:ribosomal protein S13
MTNKRVYFNKSNQSCISGFQSLYGIGKLKATRLNSFLLNHPIQTKYSNNFKSLFNSVRGGDITNNLPLDKKVALHVETHLRKKISIFCYSAFRLFQNLPTRGQRTKANAKSISNHNPYKSLRIIYLIIVRWKCLIKKKN